MSASMSVFIHICMYAKKKQSNFKTIDHHQSIIISTISIVHYQELWQLIIYLSHTGANMTSTNAGNIRLEWSIATTTTKNAYQHRVPVFY